MKPSCLLADDEFLFARVSRIGGAEIVVVSSGCRILEARYLRSQRLKDFCPI